MVRMIKSPTADDWMLCKQLALGTEGRVPLKEPTEEWKHKILRAQHSPIRVLWFVFELTIPYWVSVHLSRHKIGVEHFVQTQRTDRTGINREDLPQGAIVKHTIYINAQALMTLANMRLCRKASPETTATVQEMCNAVTKSYPEFAGLLVPKCIAHGGCNEMRSCKED